MGKLFLAIFLGIFLFLSLSSISLAFYPRAIWPEEKVPVIHKSIVKVSYGCSGFIVEPGIVITASHCIRRGKKISVEFYDHKSGPFDVLYQGRTGTENDFAILKGNTRNLPNMILSKRKPVFLDRIWHYGYGGRPNQWATPGMYLRNECTTTGCEHYISCSIIPGDSGGPVVMYDSEEVIGVVHSSYWPAHIPVGIAVPSTLIIKKLEELKKKVKIQDEAA